MKKFRVAVVGIGMVGSELVKILEQRNFPKESIKILARSSRTEKIGDREYRVVAASPEAFDDVDIAFFAGTEGAKGASQLYGWEAAKKGTIVIDNGDDFRMDPRVPLVVPEVNPDALKNHSGFVANPNCSTIQMVMAMAPLAALAKIKRVVVSTYQAVSGTGSAAVAELTAQVEAFNKGSIPKPGVYPHPIFSNVIPQIGSLKDDYPGSFSEEIKMIRETRKIFGAEEINVTATCVRVPIFNAHSEALNLEFERKVGVEDARRALRAFPGVKVLDEPDKGEYPLPLDVSGTDEVYVGRIREDHSTSNALNLWVVADNIRKGAALNAIQIAEKMIELELVS